MENARENLQKAGKDGDLYQDSKYVKTASGIAYNAVLKALDGYFYRFPKTESRLNSIDPPLQKLIKNCWDI